MKSWAFENKRSIMNKLKVYRSKNKYFRYKITDMNSKIDEKGSVCKY